MQWSDLKKNFITPTEPRSTPVTEHTTRRVRSWKWWLAVVLVLVLVILGIVLLVRFLSARKSAQPVLPAEQLQQISTFLEQNPPTPVTTGQAQAIMDTVNRPVELDAADQAALSAFLGQ